MTLIRNVDRIQVVQYVHKAQKTALMSGLVPEIISLFEELQYKHFKQSDV